MAAGTSLSNDTPHPSSRPLRLVSIGADAGVPDGSAVALSSPSPSPALRRLQRELAAAHAEARSLRELLEELPAILERKFQQRLQALLSEQRQLERENALLQQHLRARLSGSEPGPTLGALPAVATVPDTSSAASPTPLEPVTEPREDSPLTQGLGLRRALRRLHR